MDNYLDMESTLREEETFYNEEPKEMHIENVRKTGEMLIEHAYQHMSKFKEDLHGSDDNETIDTNAQFYLGLSIGLELLLKSEFIRRKINIIDRKNENKLYTISFRRIIENLDKILDIDKDDLSEIKLTLDLIRIRRDNLAHLAHKRFINYPDEHRISYVVLLIYDKLGGNNKRLIEKLKERIEKSKVISGMDYKPLKSMPSQLINNGEVLK